MQIISWHHIMNKHPLFCTYLFILLFYLPILSRQYSDIAKRKKEAEKFWEDDPEFYGIRRSHRPRVEPKPPKLQSQAGSKRGSPSGKKHGAGKAKKRKMSSDEDETSDEDHSRLVKIYIHI